MSNAVCIVIGNSAEIGLEKTKDILSFLFEHGANRNQSYRNLCKISDSMSKNTTEDFYNLVIFLDDHRVNIFLCPISCKICQRYDPICGDDIIKRLASRRILRSCGSMFLDKFCRVGQNVRQ